ncbi:MAG TPA: argininosuccinate lyase [Longimicrobiales bacterium]|nr:argininosuccinate lyase [Longimicrobiales bacterium]
MAQPIIQTGTEPVAQTTPAEQRLWGGRYSAGPAPTLDELNRSLDVDRRLWAEDIEGSRAWVQALLRAGVITEDEARSLDAGLCSVADRLATSFPADAKDEDIHSLVERLLYEEAGDVAGKLHTGRSRNDQVATDTRLWMLRAGARLERELCTLQQALVAQAELHVDTLMPAYTHLRRAQPVRVAHWVLSHFWALQRDRERLAAALERVAVLPLGSGAISGSGFPVDRTLLKELLGFRSVSANSMDAVGDRDWICEILFVTSMLATHLSRMAEDLIVFSSDEFRFIELPEAYTTGSSLMPQKRNPDGLELARGMAARSIGELTSALAMMKGTPSGYNKDFQEDKRLLFGAMDALEALLPATRETVAGMRFREEVLAAALADEALLATDLADELVRRGVPFREAHGAVGRLLRSADEHGCAVSALPAEAWAAVHPAFASPAVPTMSPIASVDVRDVVGGTGRGAVTQQLVAARALVA